MLMTVLHIYGMTLYKSLFTFIIDFNCLLYEGVLKSNASYFLLLESNAHRSTNWTASNLLDLLTQWARFETFVARGPWIVILHVAEFKVNMWVQMQQRAVIELLTAENVPLINMHWQMKVVYVEECGGVNTRWCWTACVCDGKPEQVSMNLNEMDFPELQLMPLTWNTGKAQSLISRVCPHMSCNPPKWQHSTVHKYEKNCRKLMLELLCLGSCTVFLQLEVTGFSYLSKTEGTS